MRHALAAHLRPLLHDSETPTPNPMSNGTKWSIGITAGVAVTVGLLNWRSKTKCTERLASLQKTFGTTDPVALKQAVEALGGTMPDCSGFPLFREGI